MDINKESLETILELRMQIKENAREFSNFLQQLAVALELEGEINPQIVLNKVKSVASSVNSKPKQAKQEEVL